MSNCEKDKNNNYIDPITNEIIPNYRLIKFVQSNIEYCFDAFTLYKYYIQKGIFENPFNRLELSDETIGKINKIVDKYLVCFVIYLPTFVSNDYSYNYFLDKNIKKQIQLFKIILDAFKYNNLGLQYLMLYDSHITYKTTETNEIKNLDYNIKKYIKLSNIREMTLNFTPAEYPFDNLIKKWEPYINNNNLIKNIEIFNKNFLRFYSDAKIILYYNEIYSFEEFTNNTIDNGITLSTYKNGKLFYYCLDMQLTVVIPSYFDRLFYIILESEREDFLKNILIYIIENNLVFSFMALTSTHLTLILSFFGLDNYVTYAKLLKDKNISTQMKSAILNIQIFIPNNLLIELAKYFIENDELELFILLGRGGKYHNNYIELLKYAVSKNAYKILVIGFEPYKYIIKNNKRYKKLYASMIEAKNLLNQ